MADVYSCQFLSYFKGPINPTRKARRWRARARTVEHDLTKTKQKKHVNVRQGCFHLCERQAGPIKHVAIASLSRSRRAELTVLNSSNFICFSFAVFIMNIAVPHRRCLRCPACLEPLPQHLWSDVDILVDFRHAGYEKKTLKETKVEETGRVISV